MRFSLIGMCKVPCSFSGKTSVKMPVMAAPVSPLGTDTVPKHGAITRMCARVMGSLARTVSSGTLGISGSTKSGRKFVSR